MPQTCRFLDLLVVLGRCKVLKLDKSIRQYELATKYMKEIPTKLPLNDC